MESQSHVVSTVANAVVATLCVCPNEDPLQHIDPRAVTDINATKAMADAGIQCILASRIVVKSPAKSHHIPDPMHLGTPRTYTLQPSTAVMANSQNVPRLES